jgi:hypothetical protein
MICQNTSHWSLHQPHALLSAAADNGIPVPVGLLLIIGGDLERERFVMLDREASVEAGTGNARNCKFDRQHVALFAGRVVTGGTVHSKHRAVGKGLGVVVGGSFSTLIAPEANRILCYSVPFDPVACQVSAPSFRRPPGMRASSSHAHAVQTTAFGAKPCLQEDSHFRLESICRHHHCGGPV